MIDPCCYVVNLKTGNILAGCLNAVLSVCMSIAVIIDLFMAVASEHNVTDLEMGFYVLSVALVLLFLAKICFDIFFVYGAVTETSGIIKTYFLMWIVFCLASMITLAINAQYFKSTTIYMGLFYTGFNVYVIFLSYCYYKLLTRRYV